MKIYPRKATNPVKAIRYPKKSAMQIGDKNSNWHGDNAVAQTGRSRAERWFENPGICELCGSEISVERHHKDGNPLNNSVSNIQFLCRKHHMEADGRLEKFKNLQRDYMVRDQYGRFQKTKHGI